MALDGIAVAGLVDELKKTIKGGRIAKIAQPEKDELMLTIKQSRPDGRFQKRLVISVNPSLPLMYLSDEGRQSPMAAPTFCMVLRKHLGSCRILDVIQPGLERVIRLKLEHMNEMGDLCVKYLIVELMGKHSNIIFCDDGDNIIDSIKHVSLLVSSVREVLPGRKYFIPDTLNKFDPFSISKKDFIDSVLKKPMPLSKAIYSSLTGFSPTMANELIHMSSLDDINLAAELDDMERLHLYRNFTLIMEAVGSADFKPNIVYSKNVPVEFGALPLTMYSDDKNYSCRTYDSVSDMLFDFYSSKEAASRMRQKSADLRKVASTALERAKKKRGLQLRQLDDTKKRDKYKVYGELLTTYGYELKGGEKSLICDDYNTNEKIEIPLDETKSAMENAKSYFARYAKLKRAFEATTVQLAETKDEISHLESISNSIEIAENEDDLAAIRRELVDCGYIKRRGEKNKKTPKSRPFHYMSSDGFDIYVGKNNYQNDELTFKTASGCDWWFHAKAAAGSHVIVKTFGKELPDRSFEEAARLAAYYSKARNQDKAEIDYIQKKHIKKPNGSKPGFVVYYTNYSMTIDTDITGIREVKE